MALHELTVGTICGGSDATSGLTANPAMGRAFDLLVEAGGAGCIFEETGELIGCERHMAGRAVTPELAARRSSRCVEKAARYYSMMGHASFAPGNAEGGLTHHRGEVAGRLCQVRRRRRSSGLIKPGDLPPRGGLYLLDVVPDGEPRFGFPNINDNAEIAELIACGSHVILFSTGRGSVVGSAISPGDQGLRQPRHLPPDAGGHGRRRRPHPRGPRRRWTRSAREILALIERVAAGERTCSEALGHQEFILGYKRFEPTGPACLPRAA